jgi:Family of unknown function (DUF6228)
VACLNLANMDEFRIKSCSSDTELLFTHTNSDYFVAEIASSHIKAVREIWAYTDSYSFADLIEWMASQEHPWKGAQYWESLEGEFKFSATCNSLGQVTFEVGLNHCGITEEWSIKTQICSEFGSLPILAKSARKFFGESPK